MAAVTLFTVVVKEGGISKLTEVLLIVVIGGRSRCCMLKLELILCSDHKQHRMLYPLATVRHDPSAEPDFHHDRLVCNPFPSSSSKFSSRSPTQRCLVRFTSSCSQST
jgi:hypothetical protein